MASPMTSRRRLALAGILIVASALRAGAQPAPPVLTAPVNDFARAIDPASEQELERLIRALQTATGDVVTVATVPTFQPYGDINSYAVKMFENGGAGIGQRGKDNGVLVVVAVQDRKVAIQVGYSLEEYITDGFAGQTIRETILPEFRNGSYGAGLVAGVTRIINRIGDARGVSLQDVLEDVLCIARGADAKYFECCAAIRDLRPEAVEHVDGVLDGVALRQLIDLAEHVAVGRQQGGLGRCRSAVPTDEPANDLTAPEGRGRERLGRVRVPERAQLFVRVAETASS